MRLVHVSDLHLGFSQFQPVTEDGANCREADVARTFARWIDQTVAIAPDLIVIGGDVFHSFRPSNRTIHTAYVGFSRLMAALPATPIVVALGNHDMPRSNLPGCIFDTFKEMGLHVADYAAKRFTFPDLGVSVLAVPDAPGLARPSLRPDPSSTYNVLVMHGEVQGMLPKGVSHDRAAEISNEEIAPAEWDYVALGHYHVYRALTPRMYYAGSIDYTSTNPWGEIVEQASAGLSGKGFAERNLATGEQTFHALPSSRLLVDLPSIEADRMSATELDAAIAHQLTECSADLDGAVVRLVVRNVPVDIARALDFKPIRKLRGRALHFNLDCRRPEPIAPSYIASSFAATDDLVYDAAAEADAMNAEMRAVWGDDAIDERLVDGPLPEFSSLRLIGSPADPYDLDTPGTLYREPLSPPQQARAS